MQGGIKCPRCQRWIYVDDLDNPPVPLCRECHEIQRRDEMQEELMAQIKILNDAVKSIAFSLADIAGRGIKTHA